MKENKKQLQQQITISAYTMEVIQNSFTNTLKWLEHYIDKSGYSGRWERQISESIKRQDLNDQPDEIKKCMETALLALDGVIDDKPEFVFENLQEKFYSWLAESGIRVDNCSEELTECLVNIYKVLINDGKEFVERVDREASEDIAKMTPEERREKFYKTFTLAQKLIDGVEARKKSLEGKTYKDVDTKNKFSGNPNQGKKLFGQLVSSGGGGSPPSDDDLDRVIRDVKANPQNQRLDEITTKLGDFDEAKQEWVLIRWDARLDDYDQQGKLNFNNNPIYRWESFNVRQRFEIKQALKISVDYLADEEINWVVGEVKNNPNLWRIGTFQGQTCLIHNSAQGNDSEFGTLIHSKERFNDLGWRLIENNKVVWDIKQHANEFEFQEIIIFSGKRYDPIKKKWVIYDKEKKETMLVHKSVKITRDDYNEFGYLKIRDDKMFQENRFSQGEWNEIQQSLKSSQNIQSVSSSSSHQKPPKGGKGGGLGSNPYIYGSLGIISLIGLAFTR